MYTTFSPHWPAARAPLCFKLIWKKETRFSLLFSGLLFPFCPFHTLLVGLSVPANTFQFFWGAPVMNAKLLLLLRLMCVVLFLWTLWSCDSHAPATRDRIYNRETRKATENCYRDVEKKAFEQLFFSRSLSFQCCCSVFRPQPPPRTGVDQMRSAERDGRPRDRFGLPYFAVY